MFVKGFTHLENESLSVTKDQQRTYGPFSSVTFSSWARTLPGIACESEESREECGT